MANTDSIGKPLDKAKLLKDQDNFKAALDILDDLYKKYPNSEEVKKSLIETLFAYGNYLNDDYTLEYEKAKLIFEKIINLNPKDYRAHYNLGITYFNLGKSKNAEKCFNKALRIKPDYKYCLYNLGLIYETLKNYKKALKYYEKALKLDPNFTYALSAQKEVRFKVDELQRKQHK